MRRERYLYYLLVFIRYVECYAAAATVALKISDLNTQPVLPTGLLPCLEA